MKIWAKLKEEFGEIYWLPIEIHSLDTAYVITELYNKWLSKSQIDLLSDGLGNKDVEATLKLIALLHDIGKITPSFQVKGIQYTQVKNDLERNFDGISGQGYQYNKSPHNLSGQYLLKCKGFSDDLSLIIGAHHGTPIEKLKELKDQKAYISNYYQTEDTQDDIYLKWDRLHTQHIEWALEQSGLNNVDGVPTISISAQVIITGLLIMADWISSNEDYFPLIKYSETDVLETSVRGKLGFNKWYSETNQGEDIKYRDVDELYLERFGFTPNSTQSMVYQEIQDSDEAGLYILEAPMGLGKTEISLIATEQIESKFGSEGVYFGLPTQATTNAIYKRMADWLVKRGYKGAIRLSHSKSYLNEEYSKLTYNKLKGDELYKDGWFSGGKKSLLDMNVVATIDSFLLTTLKQRHLFLRHLGLSKKVIILDEVHAYDTYMSQYLLRSIEWMGLYNVPIIIVSATLPKDTKELIIKAYLKGKGFKRSNIQGLDTLDNLKYPSLTYTQKNKVKQNHVEVEGSKNIDIEQVNYNKVYETIDGWMGVEGVKGVILNNVRSTQELAKYCHTKYPDIETILIHSRFTDEDRTKLENKVMGYIGKGGNRPKNILIIGTQLLEQSLDIDFDVLMTEVAPMDLLLQRVGRLHRHQNIRSASWQEPTMYVIRHSDDLDVEDVNGFIYTEYLISKTQVHLPQTITIPHDIPKLVSKVYTTDEPEQYKDNPKYIKYGEDYSNLKTKKEQKAQVHRLKGVSYRPGQTIEGWLANQVYDESVARVRDIEESLEVVLLTQDDYIKYSEPKSKQDELAILNKTVKLPISLIKSVGWDDLVGILDDIKLNNLNKWSKYQHLKDIYGIILGEESEFKLKNKTLAYTKLYGLEIDRG